MRDHPCLELPLPVTSSARWRVFAALGLLAAGGCADVNSSRVRRPQGATAPVPATVVPRSSARSGESKDASCVQTSHGCIALNPDVSQQTIAQTICVAGYTKPVRPATRFTQGVKAKLLRQAGADESQMSHFELDHIVPLALGGHPRKLSNLTLQPWDGEHGAYDETRMLRDVHFGCHHRISHPCPRRTQKTLIGVRSAATIELDIIGKPVATSAPARAAGTSQAIVSASGGRTLRYPRSWHRPSSCPTRALHSS
jgi:hypothetical protein